MVSIKHRICNIQYIRRETLKYLILLQNKVYINFRVKISDYPRFEFLEVKPGNRHPTVLLCIWS